MYWKIFNLTETNMKTEKYSIVRNGEVIATWNKGDKHNNKQMNRAFALKEFDSYLKLVKKEFKEIGTCTLAIVVKEK